jgi:hypothetical protein
MICKLWPLLLLLLGPTGVHLLLLLGLFVQLKGSCLVQQGLQGFHPDFWQLVGYEVCKQ